MIEITMSSAIMLYFCMTLATLLLLWAVQHYRSRKQKTVVAQKELFQCEYCHYSYLDTFAKSVTKCPQCGSFNKVN